MTAKKKAGPRSAPTATQDHAAPWADLDEVANSLPLEEFLSFRVTRLASGIQRTLNRYYADNYSLSVPEWRILAALDRFSPVAFGELLAVSTYDKALISRTVATLREKRLLETQPDPSHGKKLVVAITPAGQAVYRKMLPQARQRQAALLSILTVTERNALHRALKKLQLHLGQEMLWG